MTDVDIEAMNTFLAEARNAIVAGVLKDGTPQLTPNWFLWDGHRFYISTTRDRAKFRIFSRDPRVKLMIDDATGFRYVSVAGTVEIGTDVDEGLPFFRRLRLKHGRDEQDDEQLREEMLRDGRVLLVVTPDRPQAAWHSRGFDRA